MSKFIAYTISNNYISSMRIDKIIISSKNKKESHSFVNFLLNLRPNKFVNLLGLLVLMSSGTKAQTPASNFTLSVSPACINQTVQLTSTSSNTPTSWSYSVNGVFVSSLQNPVLTFTGTGNYTLSLIASNGSGAGSLATITLSVATTAPLFVSANSGTLCSGNTYTVNGAGASNYFLVGESNSLTGTSFTVSPPVTTTYTLFGVAPNGCPSPTGSTFTITVLQSPTLVVNSGSICNGYSFTFSPTGGTTYTYTGGSAVVSPTITSQYSVSTAGTNGCIARAVSTVVVLSASLSVTGNTAICNGSSTTLTATGALSYNWINLANTATISVSPTVSTNYSVTGLAANGCSASVVRLVNVTLIPTITVSGNTVICNGQTTNLTGNGATSTYSWSSGAIAQIAALNPTSTTNYILTGVSGPCSNTTALTVSVNAVPSLTLSGLIIICPGQTTSLTVNGANNYNWSTGPQTQVITLSPTVTTSYTVTGTSANCSNSAQVTISVKPTPIFTVNSGTICAGKGFTIVPMGNALSYSYSGNYATVMPSLNTNYTVTGIGANGCKASMVSGVTVNPLPNVTISPTVSSICYNQVAVLTAGGATTYTWNTGSNNFAIIITPTITTNYTISGTDPNGCINTATASLKVTECVGVLELKGNPSIMTIYPNPSKDFVTISASSISGNGRIEIYNALGEMVRIETLKASQTSLNISLFSQGVYCVKLLDDNKLLAQSKFIKE